MGARTHLSGRAAAQVAEAGAARKALDLSLTELGPYSLAFTRSGRHMLLAGRKGHLAMLDWQRAQITCELQVRETTHDALFLHNEQFFAAAQKKHVYIYDKRGIEVHCLKVRSWRQRRGGISGAECFLTQRQAGHVLASARMRFGGG